MEFLIVRHGMTEGNREKRYIGGRTDQPVCEDGLAALKLLPVDESVQAVFVSPLVRTQQTASILFPNAVQTVVEDLREMDFGRFETRRFSELEFDAAYRAWVGGGCEGPCPGGESRAQFVGRVCAAVSRLVGDALAQGRDRLVLVAHGGTVMAVGSRFGLPRRDYYDWQPKNGVATRFLVDPARWRAEQVMTWEG